MLFRSFVSDVAKGGKPYIAAKYHDYFTSCLPAPQKGPDVLIPSTTSGVYPVVGLAETHDPGGFGLFGKANISNSTSPYVDTTLTSSGGETSRFYSSSSPVSSGSGNSVVGFEPLNLWAQSSGAIGATINQLRLAFQVQKLYERDARGGLPLV